MSQKLTDQNGTTAAQPATKQVWATPSIETYDVAAFTLGTGTSHSDADGLTNLS